LELVQERHEMLEVAPETVEPPHDNHIDLPPLGISHEPIEGRAFVLHS
jgi:hypothetical protein